MTQEEIAAILADHVKWLRGEGGKDAAALAEEERRSEEDATRRIEMPHIQVHTHGWGGGCCPRV